MRQPALKLDMVDGLERRDEKKTAGNSPFPTKPQLNRPTLNLVAAFVPNIYNAHSFAIYETWSMSLYDV
jgi:hypothetical protein